VNFIRIIKENLKLIVAKHRILQDIWGLAWNLIEMRTLCSNTRGVPGFSINTTINTTINININTTINTTINTLNYPTLYLNFNFCVYTLIGIIHTLHYYTGHFGRLY
jgi:hypothetical protein